MPLSFKDMVPLSSIYDHLEEDIRNIEANSARLKSCDRHEFTRPVPPDTRLFLGNYVECEWCRGRVPLVYAEGYADGLKAGST